MLSEKFHVSRPAPPAMRAISSFRRHLQENCLCACHTPAPPAQGDGPMSARAGAAWGDCC
jgi:hypothetical protein